MGCRQCLPLSVVHLKGKHCRKPHCRNGVVDTFGLGIRLELDDDGSGQKISKIRVSFFSKSKFSKNVNSRGAYFFKLSYRILIAVPFEAI